MIKERKSSAAFSKTFPRAAYDLDARERKARTALAVLRDYLKTDLGRLTVLDIGASTGSITHYLANHFGQVVGADIDRSAVNFARRTFRRQGLDFGLVDGMELAFRDNVFDVAICNHVYEHLPDPRSLLDEVYRVLKPGGVCYFAADNRLTLWEPHYRLPLLSVLPRPLSHLYLRLARGIKTYDEKLLGYWSLRSLVARFSVIDYTRRIIQNPSFF